MPAGTMGIGANRLPILAFYWFPIGPTRPDPLRAPLNRARSTPYDAFNCFPIEIMDTFPNWLREYVYFPYTLLLILTISPPRILLIISFVSFLPQLHLLWARKDASGISLYYVLYNLISATEQLTIAFTIMVNMTDGADAFVHKPRSAGDWLNLSHMIVVWLLFLL